MKPKRKNRKAKTRRIVRVKTASRVGKEPLKQPIVYDRPYWMTDPEDDMRF